MLITICCILVRYKMYYLRFKCCLKSVFTFVHYFLLLVLQMLVGMAMFIVSRYLIFGECFCFSRHVTSLSQSGNSQDSMVSNPGIELPYV
jgi:hypothetical protein